MAQPFANQVVNILDNTLQAQTLPAGIAAIAGVTQRGILGEAVYCRSWQQYRENFGELLNHSVSLFPIYAKRVFDNGGQLVVARIEHLADINDPSSFTAVVATATNGGVFALSAPVYSVNVGLKQIVLKGDYSAFVVNAQAHVVQKFLGGTTNLTTAGLAVFASGFTTITYTTFVLGDATPGDTLTWSVSLSTTATINASSCGTWGNSISFEIKKASSGVAGKIDIFVYNALATDLNETFRGFSDTPTVTEIDNFNESMKLVQLGTIITPIGVCPIVPLLGGTDDLASINNLDYIGSITAGTGLHSFDATTGIVKVAIPDMVDNVLDLAVLDYVKLRKDSLAISRTPEGAEPQTAIDYRNQTGAYLGTALNDWRAIMLYGGIKILSPYDNSSVITISCIADYLGLSAVKDNAQGQWFSISGTDTPLQNVRDIVYNVYTFARAQQQTDIAAAGLIPIIQMDINGSKRIVFWGNSTMQINFSQLQYANVAELTIFIANQIKPISEAQLFKPNDPLSWKTIYRKVDVFMRNLVALRGIEAYRYVGDQNADTVNDAVINTPTTIAAGKYIFNLFYSPIGAILEVEANAVVTDRGVLIDNAQ